MSLKNNRKGRLIFTVAGNRFSVEIRKNKTLNHSPGLEAWYTNMVTNKIARAIMRIENVDLNSLQIKSPKE